MCIMHMTSVILCHSSGNYGGYSMLKNLRLHNRMTFISLSIYSLIEDMLYVADISRVSCVN